MSVEPEQFDDPFSVSSLKVPRVVRAASGGWSVEFEINARIKLPDGREIRVNDRHVMVRATEQRGRKKSVERMKPADAAAYHGDIDGDLEGYDGA